MKKIRNISLLILLVYIIFIITTFAYSYYNFTEPEPSIFGDINNWYQEAQANIIFISYLTLPIILPSIILFIYTDCSHVFRREVPID